MALGGQGRGDVSPPLPTPGSTFQAMHVSLIDAGNLRVLFIPGDSLGPPYFLFTWFDFNSGFSRTNLFHSFSLPTLKQPHLLRDSPNFIINKSSLLNSTSELPNQSCPAGDLSVAERSPKGTWSGDGGKSQSSVIQPG